MARLKTCVINVLENGTTSLSAGTEDAAYPLYRVRNRDIGKMFKNDAAETCAIKTDQGATGILAFDRLLIPSGHNLSGNGTLKLAASSDDFSTETVLLDTLERLSNTSDFSNAAWVKTGATSATAGLITFGDYGVGSQIYQEEALVTGDYILQVELKAKDSPGVFNVRADRGTSSAGTNYSLSTSAFTTCRVQADLTAGGATLYAVIKAVSGSLEVYAQNASLIMGTLADDTDLTGLINKTFDSTTMRYEKFSVTSPSSIVQIAEIFLTATYEWEANPQRPAGPLEDVFNAETDFTADGRPRFLVHGLPRRQRVYTVRAGAAQMANIVALNTAWAGAKPFWLCDPDGAWIYGFLRKTLNLREVAYGSYVFDFDFLEIPA